MAQVQDRAGSAGLNALQERQRAESQGFDRRCERKPRQRFNRGRVVLGMMLRRARTLPPGEREELGPGQVALTLRRRADLDRLRVAQWVRVRLRPPGDFVEREPKAEVGHAQGQSIVTRRLAPYTRSLAPAVEAAIRLRDGQTSEPGRILDPIDATWCDQVGPLPVSLLQRPIEAVCRVRAVSG